MPGNVPRLSGPERAGDYSPRRGTGPGPPGPRSNCHNALPPVLASYRSRGSLSDRRQPGALAPSLLPGPRPLLQGAATSTRAPRRGLVPLVAYPWTGSRSTACRAAQRGDNRTGTGKAQQLFFVFRSFPRFIFRGRATRTGKTLFKRAENARFTLAKPQNNFGFKAPTVALQRSEKCPLS